MGFRKKVPNKLKESGLVNISWYSKVYNVPEKKVFEDFIFNNPGYEKNPNRVFDLLYFISENEIELEDKEHPIIFYLENWKEGYRVSIDFDTRFYLDFYQDVKNAGVEPVSHYVNHGKFEKRLVNRDQLNNQRKKGLPVLEDAYPFYEILEKTDNITKPLNSNCVALIAELDIPQCKKYRVLQMKSLYEQQGFRVILANWRDFWASLNALQYCSTAFFYRVPYSKEFITYYKEVERLGIEAVYDIDDPIFNTDIVLENANINYLDIQIRENVVKDALIYGESMEYFKKFIVSTDGLKKVLLDQFDVRPDNVVVRRNLVDEESFHVANLLKRDLTNDEKVKLIYGTPSLAHSADFAYITEALEVVLLKYPQSELIIVGDVSNSDFISRFTKRVSVYPSGDYQYFLQHVAQADINLVPLLENSFNKTKSNIKFLDATIAGTCTIASNIGDYSVLPENSLKLVSSKAQWIEGLSDLIENKEVRIGLLDNAMKHISDYYNIREFDSAINI